MNKGLFKTALLLLVMAVSVNSVLGQDQKPRIMVLPSDMHCEKNGYTITNNVGGMEMKEPDYKKVMENNKIMSDMIAGMENFMQKENFTVTLLYPAIKGLASKEERDKADGIASYGTTTDKLLAYMQPDIVFILDFMEKKMGPRTQINFNLQAVDPYPGTVIFSKVGSFTPNSSDETANEFQNAIMAFKDDMFSNLMNYYNSLFTKGRQITVTLVCSEECPISFEETFGDSKVSEIIENWMGNNTVNGRFSTDIVEKSQMKFNQVCFPLQEGSTNINTHKWAQSLRNEIKRSTGKGFKLETRRIGLHSLIIVFGREK